MYSISGLGSTETFVTHINNGLKKSQVQATATTMTVELAPLSVNSIVVKSLVMGTAPLTEKSKFSVCAFPNPANDLVNIDFTLPEKSRINIEFFNSNGQLIKTLANSFFDAGNNNIAFNSAQYPDGIYWIRLCSESNVETVKLIKAKNN